VKEDQSGSETGVTGHYQVVDYDNRLRNHSDGFSRALEDALDQAKRRELIAPGQSYDSEIRFSVGIEYTNPPWIGDYRVYLDPSPRP
jgi:hypothetical protein